jgi:hypothetical protein
MSIFNSKLFVTTRGYPKIGSFHCIASGYLIPKSSKLGMVITGLVKYW